MGIYVETDCPSKEKGAMDLGFQLVFISLPSPYPPFEKGGNCFVVVFGKHMKEEDVNSMSNNKPPKKFRMNQTTCFCMTYKLV